MINMSNVYYVNSQNLVHGILMDVEAGICFTSLDSAIFYIGTKCGEISKRFGKKDYDIKVNIYNSDMSDKDIKDHLVYSAFANVIPKSDKPQGPEYIYRFNIYEYPLYDNSIEIK